MVGRDALSDMPIRSVAHALTNESLRLMKLIASLISRMSWYDEDIEGNYGFLQILSPHPLLPDYLLTLRTLCTYKNLINLFTKDVSLHY